MLTVNDLMTVGPCTVSPDTPLRYVIRLMKEEGCRQLPVVDRGKLVGIITDRDVHQALNAPCIKRWRRQDEELLDHFTAASCMTADPITVTPDTPAWRAAEMLSIYKFGALPVVDGQTVVGIVSVTDFLDYFAEEKAERPLVKI
ncbi:MAG TPA: CBS domain-containing protein [Anaerolineae bacterium]